MPVTFRANGKNLRYVKKMPLNTSKPLYKRVKKIEKKLSRVEKKFFDYSQVNQSPGASAVIYPISQVVQNDGYNQRTGNDITAVSLFVRLNAIKDAIPSATAFRVIIVADRECRAATPAASDVLEDANNYLSPINHVNGKRFKVILDKVYALTASQNMVIYKRFIKLRDMLIRFQDQFGTTPRENSLFLLLVSDNTPNPPGVDFYTRLRFTDA